MLLYSFYTEAKACKIQVLHYTWTESDSSKDMEKQKTVEYTCHIISEELFIDRLETNNPKTMLPCIVIGKHQQNYHQNKNIWNIYIHPTCYLVLCAFKSRSCRNLWILDNPGTALRIGKWPQNKQILTFHTSSAALKVTKCSDQLKLSWAVIKQGGKRDVWPKWVILSAESQHITWWGSYGHIFHCCPQICQARSTERRRQPVYLVALLCLSSAQDTPANVFGWNISHTA